MEIAVGDGNLSGGFPDGNQIGHRIVQQQKRAVEEAPDRHILEIGDLETLPDNLRGEAVSRSGVEVDELQDECRPVVPDQLDILDLHVLVRLGRGVNDHIDLQVTERQWIEH